MSDIAIVFDGRAFQSNWQMQGGDLRKDGGLETATIASLFTDGRARDDDELPGGETNRRGYWGNSYPELIPYPYKSRLWLLWREKQTEETARRAEEYCDEALAWMITAGVARAVEVTATWIAMGTLRLVAVITRPDGERVEYRYEVQWKKQFEAPINAV